MGRKKHSQTFTRDDLQALVVIVDNIRPFTGQMWGQVANEYNTNFAEPNRRTLRDARSLHERFRKLAGVSASVKQSSDGGRFPDLRQQATDVCADIEAMKRPGVFVPPTAFDMPAAVDTVGDAAVSAAVSAAGAAAASIGRSVVPARAGGGSGSGSGSGSAPAGTAHVSVTTTPNPTPTGAPVAAVGRGNPKRKRTEGEQLLLERMRLAQEGKRRRTRPVRAGAGLDGTNNAMLANVLAMIVEDRRKQQEAAARRNEILVKMLTDLKKLQDKRKRKNKGKGKGEGFDIGKYLSMLVQGGSPDPTAATAAVMAALADGAGAGSGDDSSPAGVAPADAEESV